jgi:hypothetical protein
MSRCRHRKAGNAVHQTQHVFALVTEIFGHRQGGLRHLHASVGANSSEELAMSQHRSRQPLCPQIVIDKLLHLRPRSPINPITMTSAVL